MLFFIHNNFIQDIIVEQFLYLVYKLCTKQHVFSHGQIHGQWINKY